MSTAYIAFRLQCGLLGYSNCDHDHDCKHDRDCKRDYNSEHFYENSKFVWDLAEEAAEVNGRDYLPYNKLYKYTDYELIYYINDVTIANEEVLVEYGANGTATGTYEYGNERLSVEYANHAKEYYLYNGTGNVVQTTTQNSSVFLRYTYDAFGNITSIRAPFAVDTDDINRYTYNGEDYDYTTGLQYLRARYYNTSTGSFISQDTYLGQIISPLSQNRYTYCHNNPIMRNDPSGHDSYIIYDGTIDEWDYDVAKNAQNDQQLIADSLYDGDTSMVHLISIDDSLSFKNAWENLGEDEDGNEVEIDNVIIMTHSTPEYIFTGKEYVSIDELQNYQTKDVENLILIQCNAGHITYRDVMGENVASTFSKITNGGYVMASDGEVQSSYSKDRFGRTLAYIFTLGIAALFTDPYTNTKYKSIAKDDFRLFEDYSDFPRGENDGWQIYTTINEGAYMYSTGEYSMTIIEMIECIDLYRLTCSDQGAE